MIEENPRIVALFAEYKITTIENSECNEIIVERRIR
jgi:hypothetical protein